MTRPDRKPQLKASGAVTLNASGAGTVRLGPSDQRGSANWHVTGVIVQTNRPGQSPVPKVQIYLDADEAGSSEGLSYDGSFRQGNADITMIRGQFLIAQWTGGQSGDRATMTISGEKW